MNDPRIQINPKNDPASTKATNHTKPELKPTGTKMLLKKTVPLKRLLKGINYFVGVVSFEEHKNIYEKQPVAEIEIQEGPPRDITPPYVLCMNFSQVRSLEKNAEILDLSQDNKSGDENSTANSNTPFLEK